MTVLSDLLDALLHAEFEAQPVRASGLGLTEYDGRLDDLSAAAFERRDAEASDWLRRLEAIDSAGLGHDEAIDRDLAISVMRGRQILAGWAAWRREPLTYTDPIQFGIFSLFLHRLRPDAELVDAALARIAEIPRVLESGMANLDPDLAHPLIIRRAQRGARGVARYLRDVLPGEIPDGPDRSRLAEAGADAGAALDKWIGFLGDLAERAHGEWRLGEERYSRLLRERESLAFDARALRDRGQAEYDRLSDEMTSIVRRVSNDQGWPSVLERANADHASTEEGMRADYESWTERARAFLAETGLVSLPPGERCLVVPSPVFQRPVLAVASYSSPPPFAPTMLGHFFVPFAPDGTPEVEVQLRLASNSHGKVPATAVHEAYPGHHLHLVSRKANPSRIRLTFGTPYFTEGWALYAERLMRERGFFTDPIQELYQLEGSLFRAARIVVDTSLHIGEMDEAEAVTFLTSKTSVTEPTARAEVGRYCAWPTQASAYLTGCLEILRIRAAFLASRGFAGAPAADVPAEILREFHDRMVGSGSLPLGLAERAVMGPAEAGAAAS